MGRFSPSVPLAPSWTQGLAQGAQDFAQQLIQGRQFRQQKLQQDREFALQQQAQDARNAEAGYTPAGLTTATPAGLSAISNASVSDASQPASYDPTKSLTYAIMNGRNAAAMDRTVAQVQGREDVQDQRNQGYLARDAAKYGSMGPNGYTPGVMPQAHIFGQAPALQQKAAEFQQAQEQRASEFGQALSERRQYHQGMVAKPTGGNRMSIGGVGQATGPETTAINRMTQAYEQPQKVPGRLNADGSSFSTRYTPGLPPMAASAKAVHNVNLTRMAAGQDTLANPGSLGGGPPKAAVAPSSVAPHVEKDGTAATNAPAPVQGLAQPKTSNGLADQHVKTSAPQITASPTQPIGTAAKPKLSAADAAKAKSDPGFAKYLKSKYNLEPGTDY